MTANQTGSMWSTTQLDLSQPFDITFHITIGTNSPEADGLAFVMQTSGTSAIGGGGNNLGYGGLSPSVAVELDIFDNSPAGIADIGNDHVAIHKNGVMTSTVSGPINALISGSSITDGLCRPFRITWNPSTKDLQVYYNGQLRLTYNDDIANTTFGGSNLVYWGLTSSTGAFYTQMIACYEFANAGADVDMCQGNTATFTATSGNSYVWSPGTNLSSTTTASTVFTPPSTGNYGFEVTVTNTYGCTDKDSLYADVYAKPSANAGANKAICEGDSVMIGTPAVAGRTYSWSPATGLSNPNIAQPMASPASSTTYTLTVTDISNPASCQQTDQMTVTVNTRPTAQAGLDKTICEGSCTSIGGGSSEAFVSYNWSPATGLQSQGTPTVTACPTTTTAYVLTATQVFTTCSRKDTVIVNVNPAPPANAGADTTLCFGDCATIGTAGGAGYTYAWSPSAGLSSISVAQPQACPDSTTKYYVTWTDISTTCTATDSIVVSVNALPAVFAGADTTICAGDCATIGDSAISGTGYSWSPGTGVADTAAAMTFACPASSLTDYILTAYDSSTTCVNTDTVRIMLNPLPVAAAGTDTSVCEGACIQIGSAAISNHVYAWMPGTTLSDSTIAQPTACPDSTGWFYLMVTDTLTTCSNNDSIQITVNPLPQANAGADSLICEGSCIQIGFGGIANGSYSWIPFATVSNPSISNPVACPGGPTNYVIMVTDTLTGCSFQDSVFVDVAPLPTAAFSTSSNMLTVTFTDNSTGAVNWSWDFGDGNSSGAQNPVYTYSVSGTYQVCLTIESQEGCQDTICQSITVTTVGIEPEVEAVELDVYPVPFSEKVTIASEDLRGEEVKLLVTDIHGRIIIERSERWNDGRMELNTTEWAGGVYVLQLISRKGKVIRKLVRE